MRKQEFTSTTYLKTNPTHTTSISFWVAAMFETDLDQDQVGISPKK